MRSDTSAKPVLIAALGVALFSMLDAAMKVIASSYPIAQSTGMRYYAAALTATAFYMLAGGRWPTRDAILRSFPRTVANLVAGACFFLALSRLALVDAIVLTFLSPFFLAVWGWVFLREPLKKITLLAIIVGLVGVYMIARAQIAGVHHKLDLIGFLAAIVCAALYALSMVMTRDQSQKDSLPTLVLLPSVVGALLATPFMISTWRPVSLRHFELIACVGVFATAGYVCLAWAYRNSHVGRLGLMEYTGLIWATIFGYFVFHEVPSVETAAGALLIVGACLPAFHKVT
jgi:S-adenosylmethionine uptake transporter